MEAIRDDEAEVTRGAGGSDGGGSGNDGPSPAVVDARRTAGSAEGGQADDPHDGGPAAAAARDSGPDWWTGITVGELERVRRDLRDLIQFIDKHERKTVVVNIADTFGEATTEPIGPFTPNVDLAAYRGRVDRFVDQVRDHSVVRKITSAQPLTPPTSPSWSAFSTAPVLPPANSSSASAARNNIWPPSCAAPLGLDRAGPNGLFPDDLIDDLFTLIQRINTTTEPPPAA